MSISMAAEKNGQHKSRMQENVSLQERCPLVKQSLIAEDMGVKRVQLRSVRQKSCQRSDCLGLLEEKEQL